MKLHFKFISMLAVLSLLLSACSFLGLGPTLSPEQIKETAVRATLENLPTNIPTPTRTPVGFRFTPPTPTATLPPTETPAPPVAQGTSTPVSLLPSNVTIEGLGCIPTNTRQDLAVVLKVIDGDTIQAILNGKTVTVHYIGIDAPQMPSGSNPGGRMAQESYQKNKYLVDGKIVILVKDTSEADGYGNLLRYVLIDNVFVNYEMVKQGMAVALASPPDIACRSTLETVQQSAIQKLTGLWKATPTSTARPGNLPSLTPTFKKSVH